MRAIAFAIVLAACGAPHVDAPAPIVVATPEPAPQPKPEPARAPEPSVVALAGDAINVYTPITASDRDREGICTTSRPDGPCRFVVHAVTLDELAKVLGDARDVVIEAPASTAWGRVILVLDRAKAPERAFVLSVEGEPSRRTPRITLPKAGDAMPPAPDGAGMTTSSGEVEIVHTIAITREAKIYVDRTPRTGELGELPEGRIIVQADTEAPFGTIVDVARAAMKSGARVAFAVAAPAPPPSSGTKPHARADSAKTCKFPASADKSDIDEAAVTIRVKIAASGKVTDVAVVADPGHGFGDAAKSCARKMAFDPARDESGKAIDAELVMRIRFAR